MVAVLLGAVAGVLSGCGIGGGSLLLLWLTWGAGLDQRTAGGVNLVYFIACAVPAVWGHLRRGLPVKEAVLWGVAAGAPACIAGALLAAGMELALLRRIFGGFLLAVGIRELFPKKTHNSPAAGNATGQTNELEGTK